MYSKMEESSKVISATSMLMVYVVRQSKERRVRHTKSLLPPNVKFGLEGFVLYLYTGSSK